MLAFIRLACAILIVLVSGTARAGTEYYYPITIFPAEGRAFGSIRDSIGGSKMINCDGAQCQVRDATGLTTDCFVTTSDGPLFTAFEKNARAINSISAIGLSWNPATRRCTDLWVANGSQFMSASQRPGTFQAATIVNPVIGHAFGTIASARNLREGGPEFISCVIFAASGNIQCDARNENGVQVSCTASEAANPKFADAVRAIDSISSVSFNFDPVQHTCTSISVEKFSTFLAP